MSFTEDELPALEGRVIVITGANSGIGLEAAAMLASAGAHVVMACRSPARGEAALERVRAARDGARAELMRLDLADLASVRAFADALLSRHPRVDVLINNAGVMALPHGRTADGFERQIGTNHLGHFALTVRVLREGQAPPARVVTVASHAHRWGRIRFDDLHGERRYHPWLAYGQSKLANLLFMNELARRAPEVTSVACHPGYASTNLQGAASREAGSGLGARFWDWANGAFAQSARAGALPTVHAAVRDDLASGDYLGPRGPFELVGAPRKVRATRAAQDRETAARLWALSEELTGERLRE